MINRKKKSDASHVGDFLSKSLKKMASRADLELLELWECWTEAVGKEVAEHTRPKAFRGTLLHVTVDSSVWMHHLTLMKGEILRGINEKLGEEVLSDLRFSIGALG